MQYPFPYASHINDYLQAIKGHEEFLVKRDEESGMTIINYVFATETSFPDPMSFKDPDEQRLAALRLDCRGIKFDLNTGKIVTRPYNKFFNVNERPEYLAHNIDWTRPHIVLTKMDGSMVTAFRRPDGLLEWHTKMGHTQVAEPVEAFVASSETPYEAFVDHMMEHDLTAIFEWCSLQQRIVLAYTSDMLVLTGIRHNFTGEYLKYDEMTRLADRFAIPVVEVFDSQIDDITTFLDKIASLSGAEGVVVRFDDGSMCKIKAEEYVRIHRSRDGLVQEKNVWDLIMSDSFDDAKALMIDTDREMVEAFAKAFDAAVITTAKRLGNIVSEAKVEYENDKKQFAINLIPTIPKMERGLLFQIWDGENPVEVILRFLKKNTATGPRIDAVRSLVNDICWSDFHRPLEDVSELEPV